MYQSIWIIAYQIAQPKHSHYFSQLIILLVVKVLDKNWRKWMYHSTSLYMMEEKFRIVGVKKISGPVTIVEDKLLGLSTNIL